MFSEGKTDPECTFCRIVDGSLAATVVRDTEDVLAIMDLYPATRGHLLVMPKSHIEDVFSMPEDLSGRLMAHATMLAKVIQRQLAPVGMNLIQASGGAAGQTIFHFHLHVVPRYEGDNVMLRFGHGRSAPERSALEDIAARIKAGLP